MTIYFRYSKHLKKKPAIAAPFIPIVLHGEKGPISFIGLLDSGADTMTRDVANVLGLTVEKEENVCNGIGGPVKCARTIVFLSLDAPRAPWPVRCLVNVLLCDEENGPPILIGRQGFFQHFDLTLRQTQQRIELKPVVV